MKVALRDDDTCYFTTPETLHRIYGEIWPRVPVCLATVPFAIGYPCPGIPEKYWKSGDAHPLERNTALVDALRRLARAGRATIALHGYTHEDFPGGYEFQAAPDMDRRLAEGRAYLEQLLDTSISVFVPPHNALSKRGLRAVSAAGLNLLGSFLSFRPSLRPWDWRTLGNWWRVRRYRRLSGRGKRDGLVYPRTLRYDRHAEFGCHGLIPGTTFEDLVRGFEEARAFGGDFCLATHYWEIDRTLADILARFLDYARRFPDVRFVTAEELFE